VKNLGLIFSHNRKFFRRKYSPSQIYWLVSIILLLFFWIAGCADLTRYGDDIDFTWIEDTTLLARTNHFRNGALTEVTLYQYFTVVQGSGKTTFVTKLDDREFNKHATVEEGRSYRVQIEVSIAPAAQYIPPVVTYQLELDSPSAPSPVTMEISWFILAIQVDDILISEWSP
jgi:hypothetical protein